MISGYMSSNRRRSKVLRSEIRVETSMKQSMSLITVIVLVLVVDKEIIN